MVTLIKTLQLVLALSLLIFIHELGHFLWARIFKIRVEKFYLFFDVGGKALFRFKRGETEFGIGWLPLGGYCKIAGMIDESLDKNAMASEPKEYEFRSKPAWQRLFVMAGGVVNNFIFAVVGFCLLMGIWGDAYLPNKGAQIYATPLATELGFQTGDEILKMDDYVPESFLELQSDLARRDVSWVTVRRGDDTLRLYIDQALIGEILNTPMVFDLAWPFVVDSVSVDSPNSEVLLKGDRLTGLDGRKVEYLQDAKAVLAEYEGQVVPAEIMRGEEVLTVPVEIDSLGHVGVFLQMPRMERKNYSFFEAIPAGFKMAGKTIASYIQDLKLIAKPSTGAYKSVGSFIAIGQVMPSDWNWYQFIYIVSLLSVMLGVMNLIPIPGLDGGHILFTLYEILTGRKPSDNFLYIMQLIGMALLIGLMILAFGNDITRLLH